MVKNILIVDDQPGIRLLLTDILEGDGYSVTAVETGAQALENVKKTAFDLIILDYKLPVMNGVEVLNRLEQKDIGIPAILMSGLVEEMKMEEREHSLIKEVLAKPFDVKVISDIVRSLLSPVK